MQKDFRTAIEEKRIFDQLSQLLGSTYAACMYLASKARSKQESMKYLITESESLSWALTGELPKTVKDRMNTKSRMMKDIEDILNYVEDDEVQSAARESFRFSVDSGHLVYIYRKIQSRDKQSRVRILTRMMYYKYKEENYNA